MKKILKLSGKWFLVAVVAMGILLNGPHVQAAKALNEEYANSAGSVLLDKETISYTASLPGIPDSDDGALYLYELQPYEYAIAPGAVPVASVPATASPVITLPYNEARLYTKLALAVKVGGQNVMIASPQYIANPELLATHTSIIHSNWLYILLAM